MAQLISRKALNLVVSHIEGVRHAVHREAEGVGDAAKANLEAVRATTTHSKIVGPGHLTDIDVTQHEVDSTVDLVAPNAMAIEFGHSPSGYFDPARYGRRTKAPEGLYILHKAAGFGLE